MSFFNYGFSQVKDHKQDSTHAVYERIENYSEKSKSTKLIHKLIFKSKKKPNNKSVVVPTQDYRQFEGKIIRDINIESHDPFGFSISDSTKTTHSWLERTGNKLHLKSKDFAIKNVLIFNKNKPLDGLLLKESKRLLRDQGFIRDVEIRAEQVEGSPDSVDVYVTTLDSWSLVPRGAISKSKMKLKLNEHNFLGFGHQLKLRFDNRFDDGKWAHEFLYAMPNFKNTYISTAVGYSNNLDEAKSKFIDIERTFFSPYTKWAAGVYLDEQFTYKDLPDANMEFMRQDFKYQSQDVWAGYSFHLFKGKSERERTANIISAVRFLNIDYKEKPTIEFDSIQFFSNETFYLSSIGISSRRFVEDNYIFRDGITESVPVGDIFAITAGNQYKNEQNRFYLGGKIAHGNYYNWGYLSVNLEYSTFFNKGEAEQTAYSFSANYFTNLIYLGDKWKMRQFIKPQLLIGKNRLNSVGDRITIDERNDFKSFYHRYERHENSMGIPNFDSGLMGTSKFVLSTQSQFYPPWRFIGFRFNPYVNMSAALLADEETRFNTSKLYSSFSVGLLIKNEYLVFNSIKLSLSYYPSIPGNGNSIFKTNALDIDDFGLQGFELGKPTPVGYN
ncbi:hypothetical protein BZARG_2708 [Bizionia argentinensis JUB59]|uniref:POTRA domain-containing protein n=1 Tax=Bizionia argentinensis JUB59 TaxID=1046627 RepID=G2EAN1_9FLAO|nr:hypothetical protein BZARG_2708 [Bizionia argentinensis JUB59]